jgi:hypothetical protein
MTKNALVWLIIVIVIISFYIYYKYYGIKPTPTPTPTPFLTQMPTEMPTEIPTEFSQQQLQDIENIQNTITQINNNIQQISNTIFDSISPSQKKIIENQILKSIQSFESVYEQLIQILNQIPENQLQPIVNDFQHCYEQIIMIYQTTIQVVSNDQYNIQMKQFIDQLPLQDTTNNGELYQFIQQIPTALPTAFPKLQINDFLPKSQMQMPEIPNEISTQTQSLQTQLQQIIKNIQTDY